MGVASFVALDRKSALLRILIILAQTNFPGSVGHAEMQHFD